MLEKKLKDWIGPDVKMIKNKSQDSVFLSKDGLKKFRFDFNQPKPHLGPHCHLEEFVGNKWIDRAGQIYPINVPHY